MRNIRIGNLSFGSTDQYLKTPFAVFAAPLSLLVVRDRQPRDPEASRGERDGEGLKVSVVAGCNGAQFSGRRLAVHGAR
ncbi:MAG: RNA-binding protein [Candidatus Tectomicrobia bacterium]|nr:RNA-binding protein [Candidatus Tectomicrobia bacterium]